MTEHEGHRGAERRDLRQRQVDKDDLARQHLDAEIDVDADQTNRNQECRQKKYQGLDHCTPAAAVSAATLASNSAM